jgi:hypothetical protein
MIDTLQLLLTDFSVSNAKLIVQPSSYNAETGVMSAQFPLWTDGEKTFEGSYAYHREEHFNVTLKPQFKNDGSGMSVSCYTRFELPKFAGGNNYKPVDFKGTKDGLKQAEKQLRDAGIKTNILTAKPCRMDSFDNVDADEPYSCYQPVLALLQGSRMKQRGYENGFLWENQSAQLCAYDKRQKMIHDKLPVTGLPKHPLRFELRALQARKIRSAYGFNSVRDLLDGYDSIRAVYLATMKKQLFKYSASDVEALFHSEIVEDFAWFRKHAGARWLDKYFRDYGIFCMMQKASMETVLGALNEVEDNKVKRSRLKKKLGEAHFASAALSLMPASKRTHGELYNELQEKLLAA